VPDLVLNPEVKEKFWEGRRAETKVQFLNADSLQTASRIINPA
jgi:hypothetical protein